MDNLINYNGTLLNSTDARLSPDNRGFSFGDGFFESIIIINGSIPLWRNHLDRISMSITLLQLNADYLLEPDFLLNQMFRLVPEAGIFRVKLSIFRNSRGKYLPDQNEVQFLIQATTAEEPLHNIQDYYLSIGRSYKVYNAYLGDWKQIKSMSSLSYVIASLEARESGFEDVLILSKEGMLSESTNSNVFAIKDSVICTPSLQTGCVNGVFRKYLIQLMREKGMEIIENELFWAEIKHLDELFLTNAVQWIRPVNQIDDKILGKNPITREIMEMVRKDLLKV